MTCNMLRACAHVCMCVCMRVRARTIYTLNLNIHVILPRALPELLYFRHHCDIPKGLLFIITYLASLRDEILCNAQGGKRLPACSFNAHAGGTLLLRNDIYILARGLAIPLYYYKGEMSLWGNFLKNKSHISLTIGKVAKL